MSACPYIESLASSLFLLILKFNFIVFLFNGVNKGMKCARFNQRILLYFKYLIIKHKSIFE